MGVMTDSAVLADKTLYEVDFHAWTRQQAGLLRGGALSQLDLDNLAEEIESLGHSEERELERRLALVIMHLLKWEHQIGLRSASWGRTLREQRKRVERLLVRMPSLRPTVPEAVQDAYSHALVAFERETGLDVASLPDDCPYTAAQVQTADWLPTT